MSKVYALVIENYDALDDYMTNLDVQVFTDKAACEKWLEHEAKRQAKQGFKPFNCNSDSDHWEFSKETLHGTYRHVFNGWYHNVIGGGDVD